MIYVFIADTVSKRLILASGAFSAVRGAVGSERPFRRFGRGEMTIVFERESEISQSALRFWSSVC